MAADSIYTLTHTVAVSGYVYRNSKFLLLKRNKAPLVWAPPGGKLKLHENPREGLQREIWEETGFRVEVLEPVDTWFGELQPHSPILSIDFLVKIRSGKLRLSPEHNQAVWVSLKELEKGFPVPLNCDTGFKLKDFKKAERLIRLLHLNL